MGRLLNNGLPVRFRADQVLDTQASEPAPISLVYHMTGPVRLLDRLFAFNYILRCYLNIHPSTSLMATDYRWSRINLAAGMLIKMVKVTCLSYYRS